MRAATGWSGARASRPFLANRARPSMGISLAEIGSFLLDMLSKGIGVIADIVKVPLGLLTEGVGVVFTSVAAVISEIPVLGELVAQVLLAANAVIGFALAAPGKLLEGVSNVFGNLARALDEAYGPEEKREKLDAARENIVSRAPEAIRPAVRDALGRQPAPTGTEPTPPGPPTQPGTSPLVSVGLPAAAAAALALLLTRA